MNNVVEKQLLALEYGEPQTFGSVAVVPLFLPGSGGPQYLTMQQAIAMDTLIVTEVSSGGSVPELKVENRADMPVLLWMARNWPEPSRTGCSTPPCCSRRSRSQ